jgi:uncharacterized membrane protein YbhN (UPF0104 family)
MPAQIVLQRLNILLRIAIAAVCIWFLYNEFFVKEKFSLLWEQFQQIQVTHVKYFFLVIACILVIVNWSLETSKWKLMINKIEDVTWFKAFKAVISGITISIFTPNRVGEFAARIFYLQSNHRIRGILISIIGSISQLCVTIVVGSFCFTYFLTQHSQLDTIENALIVVLPFIVSVLMILFYYNMDLLRSMLFKINRGRKLRFYMNVFTFYSGRQLTRVLGLSVLRFMVFSAQYYLLFLFFDIHVSIPESLMLSSAIFFVLAIIPTIALAELGVRGAVAIYFLGSYTDNELSILASSYSLWCINLALPALLGLVFLPQLNFFKK